MTTQLERDERPAIEILLVEDSPADILLMQEVLRDANLRNNLSVARTGEEAMDFLRCEGKHARATRPGLILLDLNLPKKDGRAVLSEIKDDDSLKSIPVVVLTSSSVEEDILKSYQLRADCYVTKPADLDGFARLINTLDTLWLSTVESQCAAI